MCVCPPLALFSFNILKKGHHYYSCPEISFIFGSLGLQSFNLAEMLVYFTFTSIGVSKFVSHYYTFDIPGQESRDDFLKVKLLMKIKTCENKRIINLGLAFIRYIYKSSVISLVTISLISRSCYCLPLGLGYHAVEESFSCRFYVLFYSCSQYPMLNHMMNYYTLAG